MEILTTHKSIIHFLFLRWFLFEASKLLPIFCIPKHESGSSAVGVRAGILSWASSRSFRSAAKHHAQWSLRVTACCQTKQLRFPGVCLVWISLCLVSQCLLGLCLWSLSSHHPARNDVMQSLAVWRHAIASWFRSRGYSTNKRSLDLPTKNKSLASFDSVMTF